jgi:hypothetical protein
MIIVIRVKFMYFIDGMCQWLIRYIAVVFDFAPFSEVHSVNTDFLELKTTLFCYTIFSISKELGSSIFRIEDGGSSSFETFIILYHVLAFWTTVIFTTTAVKTSRFHISEDGFCSIHQRMDNVQNNCG